eukprot:scaffold123458_cov45-Attheya_sp.AAC.2
MLRPVETSAPKSLGFSSLARLSTGPTHNVVPKTPQLSHRPIGGTGKKRAHSNEQTQEAGVPVG